MRVRKGSGRALTSLEVAVEAGVEAVVTLGCAGRGAAELVRKAKGDLGAGRRTLSRLSSARTMPCAVEAVAGSGAVDWAGAVEESVAAGLAG